MVSPVMEDTNVLPLLQFDNSEINSEYDSVSDEEIYPTKNIRIEKASFSVFELKRKIDEVNGKTKLNSSFQRNDVWNERQQIELIESVLIGLPLPLFYFSKDPYGKLIVVDGRQRLTAFFKFMDDGFRLKNLRYLTKQYECFFSQLDSLTQSKIEDYQLQVNLILPPTPERVQYDIFERVNRAGTPLNKQEIRNALYQGRSTEFLNSLAASDLFADVTDQVFKKDKRMKAQYIVLRLVAFYCLRRGILSFSQYKDEKKTSADDFFAYMMRYLNDCDEGIIVDIKNKVNIGFENFLKFCQPADLRIKNDSPINMNLFEIVISVMMRCGPNVSKKNVTGNMSVLKSNADFIKNLEKHRDSERDILERFNIAESIFSGVME